MLDNAVAVINGKGGVLKTSVVAQLAGLAAQSGWKVLAVDLDPQGNLRRDLGYTSQSDDGAALRDAVLRGEAPQLLSSVRTNLDVIAGGHHLKDLNGQLQLERITRAVADDDHLLRALSSFNDHYDLILFDCPPGEALLHAEALRAAHFIVIPTQPDDASIDGLADVFTTYRDAQRRNVDLEVLGVVVGPVSSAARKLRATVRERLTAMLGRNVPVFETIIRQAQAPAVQARNLGVLIHELEVLKKRSPKWYEIPKAERSKQLIADASRLATDYQELAEEILARFTSALAEEASA